MNILNQNQTGMPPQFMRGIQEVKKMMSMMSGNPMQSIAGIMQQNPAISQVIQMCNGKNPEAVFREICKNKGIDADKFMEELKK